MNSVGETLRRERVRRNLSLERISDELKIAARLLDAIEQERFERLPGGVFTKSFVRQYAHYLGVDEAEVLGELQRTLDPHPLAPLSEARKPDAEISLPRVKGWEAVGDTHFQWSSSLPALALVVLVMLLCSGVYTWWTRTRRSAAVSGAESAVAQKSAPKPAPRAPAPQPESASASVTTPVSAPAEPGPAVPPNAPPAAVNTASAAASAAAAGPEANPGAPIRVQMMAEEPVWVSAQADGKLSFTGTLESKESRTLDANKTVLLRLGNAGGLTIVLNGKPIGPVGPRGQIRTVQLTSGGFHIVPPESPNPSPDSPTGPKPPVDPF